MFNKIINEISLILEDNVIDFYEQIKLKNIVQRVLFVDALHLRMYTLGDYKVFIDSILSSQIVEGSYCPINEKLVEDIYINPHKYKSIFDNTANLKILNYLEMCNRMDTIPYYKDFSLVEKLDRDSFTGKDYQLNNEQFEVVVKNFQYKMDNERKSDGRLSIQQLAMNVLSIHTPKGLYVLAYRKLQLDVKSKVLRPADDITICTEFSMGESKESIRKFLDADEYELLADFEKNQEKIKDYITNHSNQMLSVDDMPYIVGLGMDVVLDLHKEYNAIIQMYQEDNVSIPIKAFFGDLLNRPRRLKDYPITLINSKINLDQLLAINNGMKYPLAYIQGPPGTGKTNTIINTIVTAYFNDRTVLFTSYNNHPINGVFDKLISMEYGEKKIPFPVLRLGNYEKVKEAIEYIKLLYEQVVNIKVYEATLDKKKDDRALRAKQLSNLLKKYEEVLDLKDRREAINQVMEYQGRKQVSMEMLPFQTDLQGRQLEEVQKKIVDAGEITDKEAISLVDSDYEQLRMYLGNIWLSQSKYTIQKEVAISQVFSDNISYSDLFYSGRFDFVVYEKQGKQSIPILAIELDGKEHFSDEIVKNRDRKKNEICRAHNLQIIRVENSYARRYNHIKEILLDYFSIRH